MAHRMRKPVQVGCVITGWLMAMVIVGCSKEETTTPAPVTEEAPAAKPAEKPAAKPATKPAEKPAAKKPTATKPKASAAPSAAVIAMLAKADAVDGKTDKVVSKCTGCGLTMGGDPAHASTVGDYKLHLCSADCKKAVDGDLSKAILALKIPEKAK